MTRIDKSTCAANGVPIYYSWHAGSDVSLSTWLFSRNSLPTKYIYLIAYWVETTVWEIVIYSYKAASIYIQLKFKSFIDT